MTELPIRTSKMTDKSFKQINAKIRKLDRNIAYLIGEIQELESLNGNGLYDLPRFTADEYWRHSRDIYILAGQLFKDDVERSRLEFLLQSFEKE